MTRLNNHVLLRTANAKATTILVACSTLLITLGVAIIMEGTNHLLYQFANAQLEDSEDLRVEQRTAALEEELQSEPNQNQSNQSASSVSPNGLSLRLDRAHYIPLSPLSDSPGNQIKMQLDYSVQDPSALAEDTVSTVMEVYAENQTLLRTSSLPEPIVLDDPEGSTDGQKINPLSDPIEASLGLGDLKTEGISDLK